MSIEIRSYGDAFASAWDEFCLTAVNATFLHTRRFLSYHGNRFEDLSTLIMEDGKVVAIFPAAVSLQDKRVVVSHPGITYGGIVHQGRLTGGRMIDVLTALSDYYTERGYRRIQYKVLPHIYTQVPAQDDLYALFRLGAKRVRCDLSCTIDLENRLQVSERRRRGLKKAKKLMSLSRDPALLADLWGVIARNLERRHCAQPVHSASELALLQKRFPNEIVIRCGLLNGRVEAGIVIFISRLVWHAQYIAASESAYDASALDAIFDSAISEAQQVGARYFDFGTSNEEGGQILNDGLYRYKSEFGGGGVAHEYYELELIG
jgi:hypothetical protein